jgi:group I intron endonuclease
MNNGLEKTFIVYKHTSKTTGLSYIGLTGSSLENRFIGHIRQSRRGSGWKFHDAIRTYGEDDFESSILCECISLEEAKKMEKYYIEVYDSYTTGYNSNIGGWGGYVRTENVRKKQSESLKKSYQENKITSPFSNPDIHKKTIERRSLNNSNVWVTNNPMKNKERALEIAANRSKEKHYTFGKYRYIIIDAYGVKKEFSECSLKEALAFYNMPLSTYHKYVNTGESPSRGPFKGFRIYNENSEN